MYVFEQLFKKELGINYERIRLILFYDLAKRIDYEKVIRKELEAFYKKNYQLDYINKICFQIIYMNSSYYVESLISDSDRLNNLEETIKQIKKDLKNRENKNNELAKIIESQNKKITESKAKNNKLFEKFDSRNKDYENLKKKNYNLNHNLEKKLLDLEEKLKFISSLKEPDSKPEKNNSKNSNENKREL